jgi:uncharacterized protein YutE (UPF0331/DUF86 family)
VRGKLDVIAANQNQLDWLRRLSPNEFAGDARNLDSALHRLQTSIQALLDIGAYVVGCLNLPTPQHSADIISELQKAGFIDPAAAGEYLRMVAFRNRVDADTVYEILQKNLGDLEHLRQTLLDIIVQHPDQE